MEDAGIIYMFWEHNESAIAEIRPAKQSQGQNKTLLTPKSA